MHRRLIWVGLLVVALAVMAIFLTERLNQKLPAETVSVSLRLPIPAADAAFAPYYLAIDKGFFSKHGLQVKLEPGSPELNPVKMVAQGSNDFGVVGGPELLFSARAKGAPLVGLALLHKNSNFVVVITLANSGITKISDLAGKKVGFNYGHISTDVLRMLFKKVGVSVEEVDVGFDYGQFLSQKIAAEWGFRTTAGINLPARGIQIKMISPADYGIVTQGHMLITNERMIQERPDVVQHFLNAVLEATEYSTNHVQEAIESTIQRDPNFKWEVGEKQMEIYNKTILQNSRIGWISSEEMMQTKKQMLSVALIPENFDINAAYTTRFLETYYSEKGN